MSNLFMKLHGPKYKMFCRLCAQEQPHIIPIFSELCLNIDTILYNLFAIKVSRDDQMPVVICLECFHKTNSLNEFKSSVHQAQEILKLLIVSKPTNQEIKVDSETNENVNEESSEVNVSTTEIPNEEIELEVLIEEDEEKDQPQSELDEPNGKSTRQRRNEFKNLLCTDCDEIFQSAVHLTKHFKLKHKKPVQFKCSYCSQTYKKYRSFTRHVVAHVDSKRFICEVCDRSFVQKCGLKNHLYSHLQDRTFQCSICYLKFKQLSSLFNHRKVHTHVYSCDECKKNFSTSLTLLQHQKAKHFNQKDKICETCNKGYASLSGLYYHKLSHLQQTHVCSKCDRGFNTNSQLQRHMKVHIDSGAEHTCEFCRKTFKSKISLILHKKIHNDIHEEHEHSDAT